jgi:hypothetical protein
LRNRLDAPAGAPRVSRITICSAILRRLIGSNRGFRVKTLANGKDWIVIGMMRSYYLHNG